MSAVHSLVADGVIQFQNHHQGAMPRCLVTERDALIIANLEGRMKLNGLPVRVEEIEKADLAKPGAGHSLALILTELPGGRFGTAIVEYSGSA